MSYTEETFLKKLKPYILEDMKKTKILASLTAAQAMIESRHGNSGLTVQCNNLFGIKGEYNGQYGLFWTTEYYDGKTPVKVQAKFRKYPSWGESIADHSRLFTSSKRYKNLVGCTDYAKVCKYVKDDGYATAPDYTKTLMKKINEYKLYLWDAEVLGKDVAMHETVDLPVLKLGSKGPQVLAWQNFLHINGYNPGKIDGIFGALTEEAVKSFQQSRGIVADGIIGKKTWAAVGLQ